MIYSDCVSVDLAFAINQRGNRKVVLVKCIFNILSTYNNRWFYLTFSAYSTIVVINISYIQDFKTTIKPFQ